jgi:hypothetical protein
MVGVRCLVVLDESFSGCSVLGYVCSGEADTLLCIACWTINDISNIVINHLYIVLELVLYT